MSTDWESCSIGACQAHGACMYSPCRRLKYAALPGSIGFGEERCGCGGVILFNDEDGVSWCSDCGSREVYTTAALRERLRCAALVRGYDWSRLPKTMPELLELIARAIEEGAG